MLQNLYINNEKKCLTLLLQSPLLYGLSAPILQEFVASPFFDFENSNSSVLPINEKGFTQFIIYNSVFHDGGPYHIETNPTGFCMIGTSVIKGLKSHQGFIWRRILQVLQLSLWKTEKERSKIFYNKTFSIFFDVNLVHIMCLIQLMFQEGRSSKFVLQSFLFINELFFISHNRI